MGAFPKFSAGFVLNLKLSNFLYQYALLGIYFIWSCFDNCFVVRMSLYRLNFPIKLLKQFCTYQLENTYIGLLDFPFLKCSKPDQQVILDYDYTFTTPYRGSETIEIDATKVRASSFSVGISFSLGKIATL